VELDAVQVARRVDQAGERRGIRLGRGVEPSGRREIESPWLIQTGCSRSIPANSGSSVAVMLTFAGPYSRWSKGMTSPPSSWAIN
jgi:hypothetical protein